MIKRQAMTSAYERLRDKAKACRDCSLWENATQTVFGEGPQNASVMLVGEQPGDKEDLARACRRGARPRAAGSRRRSTQDLRHKCGETLQVRAARQGSPAPEARHAGNPRLPAV